MRCPEVTAQMAAEREEMRRLREEDERAMEQYASRLDQGGTGEEPNPYDEPGVSEDLDDEIPF